MYFIVGVCEWMHVDMVSFVPSCVAYNTMSSRTQDILNVDIYTQTASLHDLVVLKLGQVTYARVGTWVS